MELFQKQNLLKLADYLDSLPVSYNQFCASSCFLNDGRNTPRVMALGSRETAGIVAHGPLAGLTIPEDCNYWENYGDEIFGLDGTRSDHIESFEWLFSCAWGEDDVDQTHRGAAARIRYFLSNGVPRDFGKYLDTNCGRMPKHFPLIYSTYLKA